MRDAEAAVPDDATGLARWPADFRRQVRDALVHLHDFAYLQTQPLTRLLPPELGTRGLGAGKLLQRALLAAIAGLRPSPETPVDSPAWRTHQLLDLRYVEGLDVTTVQDRLALGRSEYHRDHHRALDAVVSVLADQWGAALPTHSGRPPGDPGGDVDAGRVEIDDTARPGLSESGAAHRSNHARALPTPLTSFIGRERELTAAIELLRTNRLITLTGPPGSGKTRLAIVVAHAVQETFADGVAFVPLAAITDPELALPTIARALGLREAGAQPVAEILREALAARELLLVLDNFEQILEAAPAVAELAVSCPHLRVVVTSRAHLRVYGERDLPVPPLALPERATRLPPVELGGYEGVRLFVERAQAVRPTFRLSDDNARTVAAICEHLDGLPLAIELAAAQARLMTPASILVRLEHRRPLLVDGARDLPARHQTVRGAIAWSEDLLPPLAKTLFRRLGVFVGGFSAEAARQVCFEPGKEPDDALPLLGSLVDQSLVRWEEQGDAPRFRMHQVIREYACDRLDECGERASTEARHAAYFRDLVEAAEPVWGPELSQRLDRLEREQDNLRRALEFALRNQDAELALRIGAALVQFWRVRGHWEEGYRFLEWILALPVPARLASARAKALHGAGVLAWHLQHWEIAAARFAASLDLWRAAGNKQGAGWVLQERAIMARYLDDYVTARALAEESLALFREIRDEVGQAAALRESAFAALHRGDIAMAAELGEESLRLARRSGDDWHVGHALRVLGNVARDRGDVAVARGCYEECLTIFQSFRDWPAVVGVEEDVARLIVAAGNADSIGADDDATVATLAQESTSSVIAAAWLYRRAWLARGHGELRQARELFRQSLARFHAARRPSRVVTCLISLAGLVLLEGEAERAARFVGAALGVGNAIGMHLSASDGDELDRIVAAARTQLREESIRALIAEGEALTLEQAVAFALEGDGA